MTAVAAAAGRLPAFPWGSPGDDATRLAGAVNTGQLSSVAVTELALARAEEHRHLGAFWALDPGAPEGAQAIDRSRVEAAHPLAGIPLAVKDSFNVAGLRTTAGLTGGGRMAETDSEAVRRLRAAGCVPLGKTAMDPLGWTTSGQADGFPPCINPLSASRSPGGSSAGAAVAVADGIAALGLGSDTAGSVRIPAAYCGLVGFRPAPHTISTRGAVEVNRRFTVPGVIARSVRDCELAYRVLGVGTRLDAPACQGSVEVAFLEDLVEQADPDVAAALERAADALTDAGVTIRRCSLDWRARGFGRLLAADLSRRWGRRIERAPELFSESLRSSVAFGRSVSCLSVQLTLRDLRKARAQLQDKFEGSVAVLCPTTPSRPPRRSDESTARSTEFTRLFSALGWPSVTVPVWSDDHGLPAAAHLAAPGVSPHGVLHAARLLESGLAR